jgi:hypothetical protein
LNVRGKADWKSVLNTASYEAWSCIGAGNVKDPKPLKLDRDPKGTLRYAWRHDHSPLDGGLEGELMKQKKIKDEETLYHPIDAESGKPLNVHVGSIRWNKYRQKWIAIMLQGGAKSSMLGEVFYGEAPEPTGPWKRARKIVTHNQYSFYNPVHDDFFDEEDGRIIYFEGTYSETFSGNPFPTPFYDYNQMMYRLDLADPRLRL